MLTYERSRYAAGDKLELLARGRQPPPRGLATVNAWTITSIATRLSQTGFYTPTEEATEREREKEMVRPSFKYGAMVNQNARPDSIMVNQARRDQIRAFRALRDSPNMDEVSIASGIVIIHCGAKK